jgi:glucose 1-dehydrogenase
LVTGGNSGIGAAVAEGFANAYAKVMINYVTQPELAESLAERIPFAQFFLDGVYLTSY